MNPKTKTMSKIAVLVLALLAIPAQSQDMDGLGEEESSGPAPTKVTPEELVDAVVAQWAPHRFVPRFWKRAEGMVVGEAPYFPLTVRYPITTIPPDSLFAFPKKEELGKDGGTQMGALRWLNCLEANPAKANEKEKNGNYDPESPTVCLIKIQFRPEHKGKQTAVMDITLANLQDVGGVGFLQGEYRIKPGDAQRFSTSAPLILNSPTLREGLIDNVREVREGLPVVPETEGSPSSPSISSSGKSSTPTRTVGWIFRLVSAMVFYFGARAMLRVYGWKKHRNKQVGKRMMLVLKVLSMLLFGAGVFSPMVVGFTFCLGLAMIIGGGVLLPKKALPPSTP